ncbi:Possible long-chain acyl-CoA synthase [Mycobacteroides abscessus]|nr:Possible long-chain acyl-CoA synthase [Mycobacteroides abscessus]
MAFNISSLTKPVARLAATAQNGLEVLRLGGLETGSTASSHQIVESVPMYRLRRYFAPGRGRRMPGPSCSWCIR